jgi:hypothetical protein
MGGSYDSVKTCCGPGTVNNRAVVLVRVLMCRYNMVFADSEKLMCEG